MNRVRVDIGDTRLPRAPVAGGSWGTLSVGSAVSVAANELKKQLLQIARRDARSPQARAEADTVSFRNGRLVAAGGGGG